MSPAVKSSIKYTLLGLLAYTVFLLVTLPADVAYGFWKTKFGGQNVPVMLNDIEGSIWSGRIGESTIKGQQIQSFSWDVNVLTLLLGIVEANVELKVTDGYANGTVGYALFGGSYVNGLEAWLPLNQIDQLVNVAALRPGGAVDVKMSNVKLNNNTVVSAQGDVAWYSAEMTLLKKITLGDLQIKFEPNEGGVKGVLSDQGGPLRAEGVLQLNPDKSYEFKGAFGTRGEQPDLHAALTTMGRFDRDGMVKVSLKGNLAQFGL
ncbi:MAG: type II secretion system protein N [Gammaproteobacteria bacterium]|jgi:general secretion pathway protein N